MTESYPTPSTIENAERNSQLLEQSIQGAPLIATYQAALRMDPRLEGVDLVIQTKDMHYPAHASPAWSNESGRHEVHLLFDDTTSTEPMNDKMDGVPGARQLFADIVGVPPDSLTPEASNAFMLLHELGHTRKFFDYKDNPAELDQRQKREWMALPLGNVATSVLMDPDSKEHSIVRALLFNWVLLHWVSARWRKRMRFSTMRIVRRLKKRPPMTLPELYLQRIRMLSGI